MFAIYGTTYGAGDGSTTFNLPDFRNRVVWGAVSFGYIEAGLPNITGKFPDWIGANGYQGVFYNTSTSSHTTANSPLSNPSSQATGFDASKANSIYKDDCDTVQPPAIKVRVVTRYK